MTIERLQATVDRLTDAGEWRAAERPVESLEGIYSRSFSWVDRLAIWVTENVGTMGFFAILATWTAVWLAWNTIAPSDLRFDPAPAFVMWLFISNVIQIHLMPLIMVGQNLQGSQSEARAEHDLEVNIKAEEEIELILHHLEQQNDMLRAMLEKHGIKLDEVLRRETAAG